MNRIKVLDKEFEISILSDVIQEAIKKLADRINHDLQGKEVVFISILNGSFIFAADLYRRISIPSIITFIKTTSYKGTASTGKLTHLIGINEDLKGKTVVLIEDIVDTGHSIAEIVSLLRKHNPAEVRVVTLLFKPEAYVEKLVLNYVGLEIPNHFIIGFGLDYNGYARNLPDIYSLAE